MISLTTAEINAWIVAFLFPLARILALLASAPPFNNLGLSIRVRLMLGLAITVAVAPALPAMPRIAPASGFGLLILAQQMLIGFAMGFSLRLVFNAIDMAGTLISNLAGLGFATAYDPQNTAQTPVVSELIGYIALLLFLSIDGHLMVIATVVQSFSTIPVNLGSVAAASWQNIASAGGIIFSSGVLLSLPILVTLMIANIALGVLGRVAPQLNLMAIGFPVTIVIGFAALLASMNYLAAPLQTLFEYGLQSMPGLLVPR
ncbi:flagellar biosynthetic protein FliR [uncultured Propionivibrio sp.]|uniref:flagellar biosynthetic protein FliR n=1 Tax=uncultured Propionivibrio sp. TaxID=426737 RepID=UPI0029C0D5DC|nr:flagellar biosynthetic protein FliR [uncultured Propionivibrio sp.]